MHIRIISYVCVSNMFFFLFYFFLPDSVFIPFRTCVYVRNFCVQQTAPSRPAAIAADDDRPWRLCALRSLRGPRMGFILFVIIIVLQNYIHNWKHIPFYLSSEALLSLRIIYIYTYILLYRRYNPSSFAAPFAGLPEKSECTPAVREPPANTWSGRSRTDLSWCIVLLCYQYHSISMPWDNDLQKHILNDDARDCCYRSGVSNYDILINRPGRFWCISSALTFFETFSQKYMHIN